MIGEEGVLVNTIVVISIAERNAVSIVLGEGKGIESLQSMYLVNISAQMWK